MTSDKRPARIMLLLPSATYRAPDFLAAAREEGAEVIVASDHQQTMAGVLGDRAVRIPLHRPAQAVATIVAHARRLPVDAIVAVDDEGVRVAAEAAAALGLAANSPAAVAATRDKARLRSVLADAGVRQPDFAVATLADDPRAVAEALGPPVVAKPLSLSASRGVIRIDNADEAPAVADRIRSILRAADEDPDSALLFERFVGGSEVAVEGLLRGGELEVLALFDKPDPLDGPYFEETLYTTPSRLSRPTQDAVVELVGQAATAVGLVEGPVHAEARVARGIGSGWTDATGAPVLLELAARSIGGLCSRALRFGAGISLEQVLLRHALGLGIDDLRHTDAASGVLMIPIPEAGRLSGVHGQADARAVPGVVGLEITVPPGRVVQPLPEGDRYLGFVFARGATAEQVEASLRSAHALLEVRLDTEAG